MNRGATCRHFGALGLAVPPKMARFEFELGTSEALR
jgi:hypothetical protein